MRPYVRQIAGGSRSILLSGALLLLVACANDREADRPGAGPMPTTAPARADAASDIDTPSAPAADAGDETVARFAGFEAPKPADWTWREPENAMRAANYHVAVSPDGEDVQVVVFAGIFGSPEDNIARWANQFRGPDGGPAVPDVERVEGDGVTVTRVELEGAYSGMTSVFKEDHRFLAAIVETGDGPLFIRLVGPADIVDAQQPAFDRMIDGLRRVDGS